MLNSIDLINMIEEKVPVRKWEYLGIKIWPLIRLIISTNMGSEIKYQEISQDTLFSRLKKIFFMFYYPLKVFYSKFKDFNMNISKKKATVLLLGRSSSRNTKINGSWFDPNLDSFRYFLKKLGREAKHFEFDFWGTVRIPRYSSSKLIHNNIQFCKVKAFFKSILVQQLSLPGFEEMVDIIKSCNLDLPFINKKKIPYLVHLLRFRADFYKKHLKKNKIALGLCTVYYIPEHLAFILACNEMNIPSIDIQHGLQGDWHVAYARWQEYYPQLMPSAFWVWSDFEKKNIEKWAGKNGPILFTGGNLWVDYCSGADDPEIKRINREIQMMKEGEFTSHILLSLQPNQPLDYFFELIIQSPKSWFWWIRLHPRMMEQEDEIIELLLKSGITNQNVKQASRFPLPTILGNMDAHVTFNSTVVLDAELFGVKSLVLDPHGREYFLEQFLKKTAFYETSVEKRIERIQNIINSSTKNSSAKDNYVQPTERIREFLRILLAKK